MILHINEIKLEGNDRFTEQFNKCSDLWQASQNESLSEDERKENLDLWLQERQKLELGLY